MYGHYIPGLFKREAGVVRWARPEWKMALERGEPPAHGRLSSAQKAGLRYERKVFRYMTRKFPGFIYHLPFRFSSSEQDRGIAIPDGVILHGNRVTIVEVKLRHTIDPWRQLKNFYLPIVQVAFPFCRIKVLEVCHWYDPGVKLPGDFEIIRDIEGYEQRPVSKYGVWVYNGR